LHCLSLSLFGQYFGTHVNTLQHRHRHLLAGLALKDREFNSSDEIEKAMTKAWDELTFDEVQNAFHNRMSRFAWVIENGGECISKQIRNSFLASRESQHRRGDGNCFHTLYTPIMTG
jgi:hypothetical protein